MVWTCPECGREHIENNPLVMFCVCWDAVVGRESDEWQKIELVRKDRVLSLIQDLKDICLDGEVELSEALDSLKRKIQSPGMSG